MQNLRKLLFLLGVTSLVALVGIVGGIGASSLVTPAAAKGGEGWLGVRLQDLTSRLRDAMDLDKDAEGALVARVVPDSPADAAGLREGDLIVEVNDHKVNDVDDLVDLIRDMNAGDRALVVVSRDGKRRGLEATLGDRLEADSAAPRARSRVDEDVRRQRLSERAPEARPDREDDTQRRGTAPRWKQDDEDRSDRSEGEGDSWSWKEDDDDHGGVRVYRFRDKDSPDRKKMIFEFDKDGKHHRFHVAPPDIRAFRASGTYLGVETMQIGEQLADYFQVPDDASVLVTRVVKDSPAEKAGLEAGDVILSVDGRDVKGTRDLRDQVRDHDPGDKVEIEVMRKGSRRTLNATLEKNDFMGSLFTPEARGWAVAPRPPMPPDAPMPPEAPSVELQLDRLRDLPGLDHLELPDLDIELRGLDEEHMDQLRDELRQLRRHLREDLRENLHENLREIHEKLREAHESWRRADEAHGETRGEARELRDAQEALRRAYEAREPGTSRTIVL